MVATIFKALVMNSTSPDVTDFYDYLVVSGGKIVEVSNDDPRPKHENAKFENLEDRIIIPGLVDTHVHLPQYPNMGIGGELELLKWLETYTFPAERRFKDADYARAVSEIFFRELIANGTTAASVFATIHEGATNAAFEEARDSGIRANIGKVMMNRNAPGYLTETINESVAATERLAERWDGEGNGRLHYVVTPRFAPTSTFKQLKEAARIAHKDNLRIQTHLSENLGEIEWVKSLFKGTDSYTRVYEDAGLLGKGSIMAHSIYLSDNEIRTLRDTNTGIAHCPCSNSFLHSGIMPYAQYKPWDLIIGLGSDISGGYDISILTQMRHGMEMSKIVKHYGYSNDYMKATDAFYLATLGGAKVLALDDKTGSFEPGKEADFVVIRDPNILGKLNPNNKPEQILERLIYNSTKEHIERVYVQGNLLLKK